MFIDLIGDSIVEEFTFINDISSGVYYTFKYRARNVHGDGQPSEPFTILAATIPAKVLQPIISINNDASYKMSFIEPTTGGNLVTILEYQVQLLNL